MDDLEYHREQLLKLTQALRKQIQTLYSKPFQYLLTVPGIGPITAIAFLAEIGDFNRFVTPQNIAALSA